MASLRADLLELPAPAGARVLARHHLAAAREAAERLESSDDPEALHDFRVALRRLRSVLRAYRAELRDSVGGKRRRQLRAVAAATGTSRDAEVHLAWLRAQRDSLTRGQHAGLDWLVAHLEARKSEGDATLVAGALRDFDDLAPRLHADLGKYRVTMELDAPRAARVMGAVTARLIRDAADALGERLAAVHGAVDQSAAHEARIAGKRLRYLVEPVVEATGDGAGDALVRSLKALQDGLGELHDAHVFAREIVEATGVAAGESARALSTAILAEGAGGTAPRRARRADPRAGLLALLEHARALADRIEPRPATADVEIERKYLLTALPPEVGDWPSEELEQGYLPGERLVERVRRVRDGRGERYFRTVKGGRGVSRLEIEEETTHDVFAALWRLTKGRRVRKRRHRVAAGERTWEVDQFLDRDLVLAEIELESEEEAVTIPDWLASYVQREVTHEVAFGNRSLAK